MISFLSVLDSICFSMRLCKLGEKMETLNLVGSLCVQEHQEVVGGFTSQAPTAGT